MQQIVPQRSDAARPMTSSAAGSSRPTGRSPWRFEEMVMEAGLLIAGGAETTRTLIAHGLRTFCDHPDQWELLHDEPDAHPRRGRGAAALGQPAQQHVPHGRARHRGRTASRSPRASGWRCSTPPPTAIHGRSTDPDRFDVARAPAMHLAFGFGTHFCLGANLARLEVRLLLEELVAPDHARCDRSPSPTSSRTCSPGPSAASTSGSTSGDVPPARRRGRPPKSDDPSTTRPPARRRRRRVRGRRLRERSPSPASPSAPG